MSGRLSNKVALVTAAAQGIGRATAEAFVKEGAQVFAADINEAALAKVSGVKTLNLDVTRPDRIAECASRIGGLDVLFNAAGFVHPGSILECTEEDWDFGMTLNVRSMFRLIKAFLPGMIARGGSSIINVSSVARFCKRGAEPICVRRHQSSGGRPNQIGGCRFFETKDSLQRDLPPAPWIRRLWRSGLLPKPKPKAKRKKKFARRSLPGNRWVVWATPKKSQRWLFI